MAERHALKGAALKVFVVFSNSPIAVPRDAFVERIVVGGGMDEADNWIAELRAGRGDIVITADIPLASRCVKKSRHRDDCAERQAVHRRVDRHDARHPQPDGLTAQRQLPITGGPKPFAPRDRSNFLSALDQALGAAQARRVWLIAISERGAFGPQGPEIHIRRVSDEFPELLLWKPLVVMGFTGSGWRGPGMTRPEMTAARCRKCNRTLPIPPHFSPSFRPPHSPSCRLSVLALRI